MKPTSNFSSRQCKMHVSFHSPVFPDFWTPEPNELAEVIHQSFIYGALSSNFGLDTSSPHRGFGLFLVLPYEILKYCVVKMTL
jgi:hypothetical protein